MQKISYAIFIFLCCIFQCYLNVAYAVDFPKPPSESVCYVDNAKVSNVQDTQQINALCDQVWKEKKIPLFVVTIPSLQSVNATNMTVASYATALFNHWGIGSSYYNNGILFLISIHDREARIELGKDWKHDYDNETQRIMDNLIVPQFKAGNYSQGIIIGVKALSDMAKGDMLRHVKELPPWAGPLAIISGILLIAIIISLFRSGRSGWGWALIIFLIVALIWISRNTGKGGGRFGGGSSGGGGASGKW